MASFVGHELCKGTLIFYWQSCTTVFGGIRLDCIQIFRNVLKWFMFYMYTVF